jgi:hypothetical protein
MLTIEALIEALIQPRPLGRPRDPRVPPAVGQPPVPTAHRPRQVHPPCTSGSYPPAAEPRPCKARRQTLRGSPPWVHPTVLGHPRDRFLPPGPATHVFGAWAFMPRMCACLIP